MCSPSAEIKGGQHTHVEPDGPALVAWMRAHTAPARALWLTCALLSPTHGCKGRGLVFCGVRVRGHGTLNLIAGWHSHARPPGDGCARITRQPMASAKRRWREWRKMVWCWWEMVFTSPSSIHPKKGMSLSANEWATSQHLQAPQITWS